MNEWFEDLKAYLPQYLSAEKKRDLFEQLANFPGNIDGRVYTRIVDSVVYQGDGLPGFPVVNLPDGAIRDARVMIISNTCDTAVGRSSPISARYLYCPIIRFAKYAKVASDYAKRVSGFCTETHLDAIRRQRVSTMFFLPRNQALGEDCVALLDMIGNVPTAQVDIQKALSGRLFTLSNYGFYLFLFKLSVHMTRIRESVDRN
jgi:hypothetical protein